MADCRRPKITDLGRAFPTASSVSTSWTALSRAARVLDTAERLRRTRCISRPCRAGTGLCASIDVREGGRMCQLQATSQTVWECAYHLYCEVFALTRAVLRLTPSEWSEGAAGRTCGLPAVCAGAARHRNGRVGGGRWMCMQGCRANRGLGREDGEGGGRQGVRPVRTGTNTNCSHRPPRIGRTSTGSRGLAASTRIAKTGPRRDLGSHCPLACALPLPSLR